MIPLLLGLFGALFYTGNAEVRRFENSAANTIKDKLEGPKKVVRVRSGWNGIIGGALGDLKGVTIHAKHFSTPGLPFYTEPDRSKKGIIRKLEIDLQDFYLNGLRINHLHSVIPDCNFDYTLALTQNQILLSRSGVGSGYVDVLEHDLEPFILKKFHEIKTVTVRIANGRIHVKGYGEFIVIKANFEVDAQLSISDETRLGLTDAHILFNGVAADEQSSLVLLKTLNPVVDLNRDLKLDGAMLIEGLSLSKGVLKAFGKTQIPTRHPKKEATIDPIWFSPAYVFHA